MRLVVLLLLVFGVEFSAEAVTCTGDDVSEVCDLPIIEGGRCAKVMYYRFYCDNSTSGCNGDCFGDTPGGHWFDMTRLQYVNSDKPAPRWRCRCGCFAEETEFHTDAGNIKGTELINSKDSEHYVSSLDAFDLRSSTYRRINGITYGGDSELSIQIKTASGRAIILSQAHPAVIADVHGRIVAIKKASALKQGDYLLGVDGKSDEIIAISEREYRGRMLNFNVASADPSHHLIVANDLMMGDHAWQEQITSVESRIMYRNEILQAIRRAKP
ncbi:MAG: hypothetical protein OYH77_02285 [Pseudomonadota bacterium]|nr:hypothetical protein [Pseudomonadota bacterium]